MRPPGPTRRRPRWLVISGILLAKVLIIGAVVLLPAGLTISLGAVHGVALLVLGGSVAAALLVAGRRGTSSRPEPIHGPHHGHRSVFARRRRHATKTFKDGEGG
jgi:hypothetical protein